MGSQSKIHARDEERGNINNIFGVPSVIRNINSKRKVNATDLMLERSKKT